MAYSTHGLRVRVRPRDADAGSDEEPNGGGGGDVMLAGLGLFVTRGSGLTRL